MQFGDCTGSVLVRAEVVFRIRPVLAPTSSYQGNRALGNAAMRAFPSSDVPGAYEIVWVLLARCSHIDNRRRHNQATDGNLVCPRMPLGKMQRTVKMRSAVLARPITRRSVEISARSWSPLVLSPLETVSRRPVDRVFVEAIGEI